MFCTICNKEYSTQDEADACSQLGLPEVGLLDSQIITFNCEWEVNDQQYLTQENGTVILKLPQRIGDTHEYLYVVRVEKCECIVAEQDGEYFSPSDWKYVHGFADALKDAHSERGV